MKKITITLAFILTGYVYAQTKEQPKLPKQDTVYSLSGIKQNFEFIKFAIEHPKDITPNQQEAIFKWIETIKPETDSVKVKK